MKIHEYQAKELMASRGIAVPIGRVAHTVDEAVAAVRPIVEASGNPVVVVKSQIHAGGRGKGRFVEHPDLGGVTVVTNGIEGGVKATEERVRELAKAMLGSTLVTVQTGPAGKRVNRLYIEQGIDIARELYLSVVLDRSTSHNLVMASTEGGMDIEEVAAHTPEKILKEDVDPSVGLQDFQARRLAFALGLSGDANRNGVRFLKSLSALATELDTDLVEINPLVVTKSGRVMALDGKLSIDNNALFRHKDVVEMRDLSEEDAAEVEASKFGLSFIKLDGSIGCLVNGAGLAMATMDTIKQVGGEPANFLDVGGGATTENVTAAFKIITRDPNVKGIFVNIFGGIMKCDTIANGVVEAVHQVGLQVPLVVRLEGTNVALGKKIIDESGLNVVSASDMKDGARKIVELAGGAK
ncbi:MAG: ADP-forming succinate--CoA ligase subunit beta [Trueperaceae bacterium]|nr:ADP-forming succinate--CoA ligase subunit beta [Trueperaceae bacterium]MCC6310760.1 ADP-forming succinate--CoA ligase subunit beta [Trueperaceae bacterium]MCO5174143.1 ADP-forming succinate--CoA ligase subunit beta [Trueperaceae bacterium]MCW5820492.1 ADP-forming succinate--CoA ligase subunit beta [Trueperaceae bacterium]